MMDEEQETIRTYLCEERRKRNQDEARRVLAEHYPFKCCAVCGLQLEGCLTIAHLDQNCANNDPDNLVWLCHTHHWMYDAGLYHIEAIQLLQITWEITCGVPDHRARMKNAGAKAARTRKRRTAGRKAAVTRKRNAEAKSAQVIPIVRPHQETT